MIYEMFGYFWESCYILWKSDLKENPSELSSTHNQKLLYAYLARPIQHEWHSHAWEQVSVINIQGGWLLHYDFEVGWKEKELV